MPMCQCPDCKQFISSSITHCIYCGADVDRHLRSAMRKIIVASIVAGTASIAGLFALGPDGAESRLTASAPETTASEPFASRAPPAWPTADVATQETDALAGRPRRAARPMTADLEKFAQSPARVRFRDMHGRLRETWVAPVALARFTQAVGEENIDSTSVD